MGKNAGELSEFYCTKCGQKGLPVWRKKGKMREAGHLKKLFCFNCNEEVNHVEIKPFTKYDYNDFLLEFENGNFTEEGNRVLPYGLFRDKMHKEGKI